MPKKIMPGSVMHARCDALSNKYLNGEMSWEDLMKQDPLMMYSKEFVNCVAELCGVDPETGDAIPGSVLKPKPEPEPEPEPEVEAEAEAEPNEMATGELDLELDEAEEAANDSNDAGAAEDETEGEPEPDDGSEAEAEPECGDEAVADDGGEPETLAWDMCHWCQQEPASAVVFTQVQDDGGEQRLMRCDHLCRSCADRYWEALRNVQFACMSAEGEGE